MEGNQEEKPMEIAKFILLLNIPAIALLTLAGWFAYLGNGYWGWPFAMACISIHSIKSRKDRYDEEKEIELKRQSDIEKYGDIFRNVGKN